MYKLKCVSRMAREFPAPSALPYSVSFSYVADNGQTVNRFVVDDTNRIRQFAEFDEARAVALDFVSSDDCPDKAFVHVNHSAVRFENSESTTRHFGPFGADMPYGLALRLAKTGAIAPMSPEQVERYRELSDEPLAKFEGRDTRRPWADGYENPQVDLYAQAAAKHAATEPANPFLELDELMREIFGVRSATYRKPNAKSADAFERFLASLTEHKPGA